MSANESTPDAANDTFCVYLAKQFIANRGFTVGTVPEADELAEHCDIVLSRHDGFALTIACMIDRETHPGKTFDLSRQTLEDIGKACLKYTGKVNFNKMPVIIQIFEVGPASDDQRERLKPFTRSSLFAKVVPSAWIVDTASTTVWTNARFGGLFSLKGVIEKLLRSPRVSDAALEPRIAAVADPSFPWLTCAILAVLIGVFGAELVYGIGEATRALQPTITTLVTFGGLSRPLVIQAGEWYRLFSAPLLHADVFHLTFNGVAIYLAGYILEGLVGRAWFATIFVTGALGGSLLSLALNPDSLVSVGASGAVMGLFAAMLAASFRFPSGPGCKCLQSMCCCRRWCRWRGCSRGIGSTMPRISAAQSRGRPWPSSCSRFGRTTNRIRDGAASRRLQRSPGSWRSPIRCCRRSAAIRSRRSVPLSFRRQSCRNRMRWPRRGPPTWSRAIRAIRAAA
jgi:rhomboid protease GluP